MVAELEMTKPTELLLRLVNIFDLQIDKMCFTYEIASETS